MLVCALMFLDILNQNVSLVVVIQINLLRYSLRISIRSVNKHTAILLSKFSAELKQLNECQRQQELIENKYKNFEMSSPLIYNSRSISKLIEKFLGYLSELPVISFNGQKYDLVVIHSPLIKYLMTYNEIKFCIKK